MLFLVYTSLFSLRISIQKYTFNTLTARTNIDWSTKEKCKNEKFNSNMILASGVGMGEIMILLFRQNSTSYGSGTWPRCNVALSDIMNKYSALILTHISTVRDTTLQQTNNFSQYRQTSLYYSARVTTADIVLTCWMIPIIQHFTSTKWKH